VATNASINISNIDNDSVAGYIYSAKSMDHDFDFIPSHLSSFKKPLGILDFTGELELSKAVIGMPFFQMFRMSVLEKPVYEVARHLIGLGHKNIAYISPIHEMTWSKTRLRALGTVYTAAGYADGVEGFTKNSSPVQAATQKSLELHEADSYPVQDSEEWWEKMPFAYREQMYFPIKRTAWITLKSAIIFENCIPLMEKALQQKDITAWICANDLVASMALSYLWSKNVRIPQDLSVVGFDDTLDAMGERITSYNFNFQAVTEAMINFVLRPYSFKRVWRKKITDIEGNLVIRSTTGKPAR
ncbi:MAG: hypothetical protein GF401_13900, partial [Chitinivibrionales bacterium]|nr:hypothetical protein [Chitinivibrionales bacterium]